MPSVLSASEAAPILSAEADPQMLGWIVVTTERALDRDLTPLSVGASIHKSDVMICEEGDPVH